MGLSDKLSVTLTAGIAFWVLRPLGASWRMRFPQRVALENKLKRGEKFLLAFWHGEYLPLFISLRGLTGCVFTSDSFRGRVIQRLCSHFGFACEILAGSYQQRQAQLVHAAYRYPAIALAVDGPLGPFHVIKPGAISTATTTQIPIIPIVCHCRRQWTSRKRWDRFAVPKPFTTVAVVISEPIVVLNRNDTEQDDKSITVLAQALEQLEHDAAILSAEAKISP